MLQHARLLLPPHYGDSDGTFTVGGDYEVILQSGDVTPALAFSDFLSEAAADEISLSEQLEMKLQLQRLETPG